MGMCRRRRWRRSPTGVFIYFFPLRFFTISPSRNDENPYEGISSEIGSIPTRDIVSGVGVYWLSHWL